MFPLAVTDPRWYHFMLERPQVGPVNFWTPTPWRPKFEAGITFGFMVKKPYRKIGGFGIFQRYEEMGVEEAWLRFKTANGVPNYDTLKARIVEFAERRSSGFIDPVNPTIGCIILEDAVFLPEDQMVSPSDIDAPFPPEIVKYKRFFDSPDLIERLDRVEYEPDFELVDGVETQWVDRKSKQRPAQGVFRDKILKAYKWRSAISGESCTTALEASHIQPYRSPKSDHVQNGIALRVDLHRLFDAGLLSLDDNFRVIVSSSVRSTSVRGLEGTSVAVPANPKIRPSLKSLSYHRTKVFKE